MREAFVVRKSSSAVLASHLFMRARFDSSRFAKENGMNAKHGRRNSGRGLPHSKRFAWLSKVYALILRRLGLEVSTWPKDFFDFDPFEEVPDFRATRNDFKPIEEDPLQ